MKTMTMDEAIHKVDVLRTSIERERCAIAAGSGSKEILESFRNERNSLRRRIRKILPNFTFDPMD